MNYVEFLAHKAITDAPTGMHADELNPMLFPFQADIARWALARGRAAIFADCGMGKGPMQLEWLKRQPHEGLLVAPLAVSQQFLREAEKFGVEISYAKSGADIKHRLTVTNYERLENFDLARFGAVSLDESSILKGVDGKTRKFVTDAFAKTPFRLCATATPAPNDFMELGSHAEFLGVMTRAEMLSMFFVHDGGETSKWRLKGHAQSEFWRWMCSWAVMLRKPSDLGYDDGDFHLPPLVMHEHTVKADAPTDGYLFAVEAATLQERIAARRASVNGRVDAAVELATGSTDQWLIWCNLNSESDALAKQIPGAVAVSGSDSVEAKEERLLGFADGKYRVLVTKPSIAGHGLNLQGCHNMAFVGLSDSWEEYYQAVRRSWRFGQTQPVNVHIICAETEGAVVANIRRKEADAMKMAEQMVEHMKDLNAEALHGATERTKSAYVEACERGDNWQVRLGDCVEVAREIPTDSLHYSVYSPPFASLYTYSNSDRDMGNCKDDETFFKHYRFLVRELYRALMPGRLVSFHCMNLPTTKQMHGYIGIRDFRGDLIRLHEAEGFILHSEVVIWKDPVTAMQRTKALGLLYKQLKKDSCMSRQGIPDYLITMRKPGENAERVTKTEDGFPVGLWQNYASPVWMDINPSDTLQFRSAREHNDERHICPLALQVIERAIELWTNPGDLVFSPFTGIGSEGYVALQMGRKFIGAELKQSYFKQACANLRNATSQQVLLLEAV